MASEEARDRLGHVSVEAATETDPMVSYGLPLHPRWEGAKEGALKGFLAPILFMGTPNPFGAIYGFFLTPITTAIGAIYGAASPPTPPTKQELTPRSLDAAVQEADMQHRLRDLVVARMGRQYSGDISARVKGWQELDDQPDTIVEVWVNTVALLEGSKHALYWKGG
jgi:hypothetical protein